DRVRRIMERYNFTEKDAVNAIKSTDRRRKNYYENYTKHKWGSIDSHQMLLNISKLGMDKTIRIIKGIYASD
ncbi:MAG: cytidylate kinase-like family protein, partial [Clostridium sp.]|nr:cytidylate kinase-like family protein [Clostridium sp.]